MRDSRALKHYRQAHLPFLSQYVSTIRFKLFVQTLSFEVFFTPLFCFYTVRHCLHSMAARSSPLNSSFSRTNLPLSAVRRRDSTELVEDASQSPSVYSMSTMVVGGDFWGDLNFEPAVDLSLKFPTSPTVYSDVLADDHDDFGSSGASSNGVSVDDDEPFHLATAVLFPSMGGPAKKKQIPHANYDKPLPLRNFNPNACTGNDCTMASVPEVLETTRNHPASLQRGGFTQKCENPVRVYISLYYLFP